MIELDDWQKEVLEYEGNIALRSSRQVGKSTVISMKAAEYAVRNPNKIIMIVAAVERQAYLLFDKTLQYVIERYRSHIKAGKDRPTKHVINFRNGSKIMCLPTGLTGNNIRGFTLDMLICDEAAFIPEEVYISVVPSLVTTKGKIILLSTPFGREGFFHSCFSDPSFKTWHVPYTKCSRIDLDFIEREKKRLTKLQFQQEYEGEFVDELRRFFPDSLINKCMVSERTPNNLLTQNTSSFFGDKYLGVDIARLGDDDTVFVSLDKVKDSLKMFDLQIVKKNLLTQTADKIIELDRQHSYKTVYIDDGGIGAGVYDYLLKVDNIKRKLVGINNARRSLNNDATERTKLMKEDLYSNLLRLMEQGRISLFKDDDIFLSLKSIQYEYDNGKIKIFGNYSHIVEALVRAAWCVQDKHLNIWVRY